jgi:two-component system nitrogen regulation response regulator NtrX
VRELRNVIERLIIMVPGHVIDAPDLSFLAAPAGVTPEVSIPMVVQPLFDARDAWERSYILDALSTYGGNISKTAEGLGLERSNLYKKMRGLGINPPRE